MNHSNSTFFICLFALSIMVGGYFAFAGGMGDFVLSSMIFTINILVWKRLVGMLITASVHSKNSGIISLLFTGKVVILLCSIWWMLGAFSIGAIISSYVMVLSALLMSTGFQTHKMEYSNG